MNINCQLCKHRRDLHDGTTGHCHAPDCTCPGQTACVLCHVLMPPFSGHDTSEGMLCNDGSGCRRRALAAMATYEQEYIVCHALGYPDPHRPWPNTLDEARAFVARHGGEIKSRARSNWVVVA